MRVYIIGNDGIILCREPPPAVNEGEIVVASNAELHAAQLSGKRLLTLWNALPGVEKRKKVGDRDALIDQLWSAVEPTIRRPPPKCGALRLQPRGAPLRQTGCWRKADSNWWSRLVRRVVPRPQNAPMRSARPPCRPMGDDPSALQSVSAPSA